MRSRAWHGAQHRIRVQVTCYQCNCDQVKLDVGADSKQAPHSGRTRSTDPHPSPCAPTQAGNRHPPPRENSKGLWPRFDLWVRRTKRLLTSSQLLLNYGLLEGRDAPYFFCQPRPPPPRSGRQLCTQKAPDECPFANLPLKAFITKVAEGNPKLMVGLCTISSPQSLLDLELSWTASSHSPSAVSEVGLCPLELESLQWPNPSASH